MRNIIFISIACLFFSVITEKRLQRLLQESSCGFSARTGAENLTYASQAM